MTQPSVSFNFLALNTDQPVGVERFARNVVSGIKLPDCRLTCYTRTTINKLTELFDPVFTDDNPQTLQKKLWVGSTIPRILIEMMVLPFFTNQDDVVVSINNFGPVWGKKGQSRLIVIHDVWFMSDGYEGGAIKKWLFTWLLKLQISRSSKIVTVSEFSRKEISKHLCVPLNEIGIVSNCIARNIEVSETPVPSNDSYLLVIGSERKNKNILRAINGFAIYAADNPDSSINLVIVGKYSDTFVAKVNETYSAIVYRLDIRGFVDDETLEKLYRDCCGVIFPSLYEGFGIPAVEALLYGRPVLVANDTACSEIVSGLSVSVDATNPSAIALGISSLLKSSVEPASELYRRFRAEYMSCGRQSNVFTNLIRESIGLTGS